MVNLWLPGARVMKATSDGGSMVGGTPRVTWHTTENDPNVTTAAAIASYLNRMGYSVHLVWNPVTGEIVQTLPADRAGRGLVNQSGGVQTNRQGTYNIQIEVVGKASQPFTAGPCKNLSVIIAWLRSFGIADVWPAGVLKAYPASYGGVRSTDAWAKSGHFGHSQVPENVHGDPGALEETKITGVVVPPPAKPPLGNVYKVVSGDTLWGISTRFKVTVAALKAANALKSDTLTVGQLLKIPAKTPAPSPVKPIVAPPFPGTAYFGLGKRNNYVTLLGQQLVRKGFNHHNDGNGYQPGPLFTKYDLANVADFQRSRTELRGNPDGIPGPLTWKLLFS